MRYIIYICSILFSCTSSAPIKQDGCDFKFLEDKFYTEAKAHGTELIRHSIDYSFEPGDQFECGPSKIAVGCAGPDGIRFAKVYWELASCVEREILFFHEVLHMYGKKHLPPPSIMQEFMMSEKDYLLNRDKLLTEAFKF
jgi:hypothetical protein